MSILFHVDIEICGPLACDLVELLLLLHALLVDLASPHNVIDIFVSWCDRVPGEKILYGLRPGNLRVMKEGAKEGAQGDALVLAPQNEAL